MCGLLLSFLLLLFLRVPLTFHKACIGLHLICFFPIQIPLSLCKCQCLIIAHASVVWHLIAAIQVSHREVPEDFILLWEALFKSLSSLLWTIVKCVIWRIPVFSGLFSERSTWVQKDKKNAHSWIYLESHEFNACCSVSLMCRCRKMPR